MARPPAGSKLTISQLEEILSSRRSQISDMEREKNQLRKQIKAIDREIRHLGGHAGKPGGRVGRKPGPVAGAGKGRRGRRAKNAKNLIETIRDVLSNGSPKSVGDISDAALASGYKTKSAKFRNIVNQTLIKDKGFVSPSRGMYQLRK